MRRRAEYPHHSLPLLKTQSRGAHEGGGMQCGDAPAMLEHLKTPEEYDEGRAYIQRVASQEGISLA
jgi:hypothetical protein